MKITRLTEKEIKEKLYEMNIKQNKERHEKKKVKKGPKRPPKYYIYTKDTAIELK